MLHPPCWWLLACCPCTSPFSPAASNFAAWQTERDTPSFHGCFSSTGRCLQETTPKSSLLPMGGQAGCSTPAAARGCMGLTATGAVAAAVQLAASTAGGASHCPNRYCCSPVCPLNHAHCPATILQALPPCQALPQCTHMTPSTICLNCYMPHHHCCVPMHTPTVQFAATAKHLKGSAAR